MAILNSIRKRGIFLIVIIAMALFSFVLADVIRNGGGGAQNQNNIATVNGTDIDRIAFMEKVEVQKNRIGAAANGNQVMNQVWEQEVRATILRQQFEALGLSGQEAFTRKSLSEAFANNPTFANEAGIFDYAKLEEYVAIQQEDPLAYAAWLETERAVVDQALERTYFNMVKGSLGATMADGELEYRMENDNVDIQFVNIPYTTIPDDQATVSESEIEAYMREHLDRFTVDPQVSIRYVLFPSVASAADETAITNKITELSEVLASTEEPDVVVTSNSDIPYSDRIIFKKDLPTAIADSIFALDMGEVFGPYKNGGYINISKVTAIETMPDSVKARHILIPVGLNQTDNVTRTDEQAKATADSLVNILKGNRSRFAEFVTAFTADANSIPDEGRYDWYPYNYMTPEFRDFTFTGKTGDLDVVKTQFGYHIIEIEGQKNEQKAIKIATVAKEVVPSPKTENDLFTETTRFQMNAGKGDFQEVAKEATYGVRPVDGIGELDDNIPGIGNNRSIVNWAFNEETNIGDLSRFEISSGFVVAQLVRRNQDEALMSNAEGSAIVTPILRNEKKAAMIRQGLSGSTLEAIAQSQNQTVKTASAINMNAPTIAGAGTEPKVVGAAFGLKAGEVSKPIDGANGVYVVRVVAINKAPDLPSYLAYIKDARTSQTAQVNQAVYLALKNAAEIEDNRSTFY
ncbi:MAG: peptidylprolyl isomerase [Gilvibacter sp.]